MGNKIPRSNENDYTGEIISRRQQFLEEKTGDFYINEPNTLPGFTPISMYPKLWEASELSYRELIDKLITLALERQADFRRIGTGFGQLAVKVTSSVAQPAALTIEGDTGQQQQIQRVRIDMSLWIVGQIFGVEHARGTQRLMEYDPAPPYTADV